MSAYEDQLLSIFDQQPDGGFHTMLRGYDKREVEHHIRQLESVIEHLRKRCEELDKQVHNLRRQMSEAG